MQAAVKHITVPVVLVAKPEQMATLGRAAVEVLVLQGQVLNLEQPALLAVLEAVAEQVMVELPGVLTAAAAAGPVSLLKVPVELCSMVLKTAKTAME
jgi:hypothetical protein